MSSSKVQGRCWSRVYGEYLHTGSVMTYLLFSLEISLMVAIINTFPSLKYFIETAAPWQTQEGTQHRWHGARGNNMSQPSCRAQTQHPVLNTTPCTQHSDNSKYVEVSPTKQCRYMVAEIQHVGAWCSMRRVWSGAPCTVNCECNIVRPVTGVIAPYWSCLTEHCHI